VATVQFCSGALGQMFMSRLAHPGTIATPFYRIEVHGAKASITVLPEWSVCSYDEAYARSVDKNLSAQEYALTSGTSSQLREWVDAIRQQREPHYPAESFRRQVELTRAIYQSVATGQPVSLPLTQADLGYSSAGGNYPDVACHPVRTQ